MFRSLAFLSVALLGLVGGLDTCEKGGDDRNTQGALDAQFLLQAKVGVSTGELSNDGQSPECPPGSQGAGGICDCSRAPGWNISWKDSWCYEGKCYSGIEDERCIGNPDGAEPSLGDGTWCHGERRATECPVSGGDDDDDDKCKEKCSVIPPGATDRACSLLFGKTCEAQFMPENYMVDGKEGMNRDIERVAAKVLEMNPFLPVDEVKACEQCHTQDDDDDDEGGVNQCKDECSAIPAGADDAACFALWQMSCAQHFDPGNYMKTGFPHEKILEMIRHDSTVLAVKIHDMNPLIPPTEVYKCEQCHTNYADEHDDEQCKDECSALPMGVEVVACLDIWNKTCEEHFHPRRYIESGMPPEQMLQKFVDDSLTIADKIIENNPRIPANEVYKCEECHSKDMSDQLNEMVRNNEPPEPCMEECKDIPDGADEQACQFAWGKSCEEHLIVILPMILLSGDVRGALLKLNGEIGDAIRSLYPEIPAEQVKNCEKCHEDMLPPLSMLSVPKLPKWKGTGDDN